MKRRINIWSKLDWVIITIYLVMIFFGWINIYAAVYNEEHTSMLDISQRYGKQLIWIIASVFVALIVLLIDIRFYTFFAYLLYIIILIGLLAVLVFGKEVNGARSWFELGSFSLQPSEFAKAATALALARFLSGNNRSLSSFKNLFISGAMIFAPAILIMLQPDLGSALVYFALVLVIYREGISPYIFITGILAVILFIATLLINNIYIDITLVISSIMIYLFTVRNIKTTVKGIIILVFIGALVYSGFRWVLNRIQWEQILIISILLSGAAFSYHIFRFKAKFLVLLYTFLLGSMIFIYTLEYAFNNILKPHQQTRINIVLGIESDPHGKGYNLNQSMISIGSGGFSGKGFLQGTQTKFKFVPEQSTDFIFCTVGEEWGFIGTSFVIILFTVLLIRLILLAERQKSSFARIYGYGVISIILFHFIINIGMTIGLVPIIGIPLPFFSYGGSSLWGFTILLFVFLRLDASRQEYLL